MGPKSDKAVQCDLAIPMFSTWESNLNYFLIHESITVAERAEIVPRGLVVTVRFFTY